VYLNRATGVIQFLHFFMVLPVKVRAKRCYTIIVLTYFFPKYIFDVLFSKKYIFDVLFFKKYI